MTIPCPVSTDSVKKFVLIFLTFKYWNAIRSPHTYVLGSLRIGNWYSFSLWSTVNLQEYDLSLGTPSMLTFLTWAGWAGLVPRLRDSSPSHPRTWLVRNVGGKGVCLPCPFQEHFMWALGDDYCLPVEKWWGLGKPVQLRDRWLSLARQRKQCKQGVRLSALT